MSSMRFDLVKVNTSFNKSLEPEDDIIMDEYIEGYWEINKFFQLMGSVFNFVSADIKSKIEILENFRKKENGDRFETFRQMIEYERSSGLLSKSDYVSGCRTLLRLHRGLEFIREFLAKLSTLAPNENTHPACQSAYNSTLAKYHPWLIRQGAVVAMYALPTCEQLLKRVCVEVDEALSVLPEMLENAKLVHERTERLYSMFDLHDLP